MKNKLLILFIFVVLLYSAGRSNAQTDSVFQKGKGIVFSKDTIAHITLFTERYVEGKIYLHWDVAYQHVSGFYIIYRSTDGTNYEIVGYKKGIGVPVPIAIAYYFQDEHPPVGITSYKVMYVGVNNSYLISKDISVTWETLLSRKL